MEKENIAIRPPLKKRKRRSSKKSSQGITSSSSTSSTVTLPNEDMMISILIKLPLKSLIRFMAVSKSWHDMIANPHRPDSCYSLRTRLGPPSLPTRRRLLGIFTKYTLDDSVKYIPYSHMDDSASDVCLRFLGAGKHPPLRVVASSKGILLCTSEEEYARLFCVCNPLTGQKVKISRLGQHVRDYNNIRFDCQLVTSGVSAVVMHYVILIISYNNVFVFSSKEECRGWRTVSIRKETTDPSDILLYTYSNIIHAMPAVGSGAYWKDNISIMTCDLSKEGSYSCRNWWINSPAKYIDYLYPENIHLGARRRFWNIGSQPRNDCIYYGVHLGIRKEIQVWVYKIRTNNGGGECDHCWKLKHSVRLKALQDMYPEKFDYAKYLDDSRFHFEGFHPFLPGIIFFSYKYDFFSYRFKNKRLKLHLRSSQYSPYAPVGFIPFEWSPWPYLLSQPT